MSKIGATPGQVYKIAVEPNRLGLRPPVNHSSTLLGLNPGRLRLKLIALIIPALAILAVFFPTSIEGELAYSLLASANLVLLAIFLFLLLRADGYLGIASRFSSGLILVLLCIFTLFTPFREVAYLSSGGTYLLLALLLSLNLRSVLPESHLLMISFFLINVAIIAAGVATYLGNDPFHELLVNHYSVFTPGMVENMLNSKKPVFSFGDHAVAGFFYFLFFYLNWRTWHKKGGALYLFFSLSYIALEVMLQSVTAYGSIIIMAFVILSHFTSNMKSLAILAFLVSLAAAGVLASGITRIEAVDTLYDVFTSQSNGILGRYTGRGTVVLNLKYLQQNPLWPIGLGFSPTLWIMSDSGVVENMVRGSVPLVMAIYIGFWMFLRNNLYRKRTCIFLFLVYMGFEFAFSNLLYIRTLCILPFVVVYLNSLEIKKLPSPGRPSVLRAKRAQNSEQ